jgi:hypothetical protein
MKDGRSMMKGHGWIGEVVLYMTINLLRFLPASGFMIAAERHENGESFNQK